jgi:hypothetical protein
MLSAIRRRREAAPSWASEYQPRAGAPLLDAVGHGVALLDKRKEPDERCILDVRLACQNSDFDCEASPVGVQVRLLQRVARRVLPLRLYPV